MSKKNLYKYLGSVLKTRFYDSIENLPVSVWFKIQKKGDTLLLAKNTNLFIALFFLGLIPVYNLHWCLMLAWAGLWFIGAKLEVIISKYIYTNIYNEFIEKIGLTKDFLEYINAIKQLGMMQCTWIENPTPILKTEIAQKTIEIQNMLNKEEVKHNEIVAAVSKATGFRINPNEVTVLEFYSYIKANGK